MEQLEYIINGGETKRYHTWPVLREQRVDAHSFHVAMLVSIMALGANPHGGEGLTVPLLMAALTHDLAEHKFGDLPAPTKRSLPAYESRIDTDPAETFREVWDRLEQTSLASVELDWEHELTAGQLRWLKLADAMQGALYCIRERQMGNKLIATVFVNFRDYIRQLEPDAQAEMDIVNYIDDTWEQANG